VLRSGEKEDNPSLFEQTSFFNREEGVEEPASLFFFP